MEHTSSHTKTRLLESTSGIRCSNAYRNFERVTLSGEYTCSLWNALHMTLNKLASGDYKWCVKRQELTAWLAFVSDTRVSSSFSESTVGKNWPY